MKYPRFLAVVFGTLVMLCVSCKDTTQEDEQTNGRIIFNFKHLVDKLPLQKDKMQYVNAAGNPYEVNQLMYFVSEVTLYKSDGTQQQINDWTDIHYVDIDIPETLEWKVFDEIPAGAYDSISFIFGITKEKNQSFRFVNPPEVNMMWPDVLGGGYHYMMLNGKWKDKNNDIRNFAFHLGIGQLYKSNVVAIDSIYAFVQNHFTVQLPGAKFAIDKDKTCTIELLMNLDSWFVTPHVYDHNYWGGAIMQKQPAMQMIKENGYDVFEVGVIR